MYQGYIIIVQLSNIVKSWFGFTPHLFTFLCFSNSGISVPETKLDDGKGCERKVYTLIFLSWEAHPVQQGGVISLHESC